MQHRLSCEELQPQHAGEAKNNQKRIPLAPRQLKICKVDLTLVAGWRLETDYGLLGRSRPDLPNVLLHLRVTAGVSGRLDLLKEPHRCQIRVLTQSADEDVSVPIKLGGNRRPGRIMHPSGAQISVQLSTADPAINRLTADAEPFGQLRLRHALL